MITTVAVVLASFVLLAQLGATAAVAQGQNGWSAPHRLSSFDVKSSEAYMVADDYGYVHAFWIESDENDQEHVVQYARFDGEFWSQPNDIYIRQPGSWTISDISPYIDRHGALHLITVEGNNGPVYYMTAPAHEARSAANWSEPFRLDIQAHRARLLVDDQGKIHILFANFRGEYPGIYYVRSEDGGMTWSNPFWLDPDIPGNQAPNNLQFVLDDSQNLHAVWSYLDVPDVVDTAVRYARSEDGGNTWSTPLTVDEADESDDEVRLSVPNLITSGDDVHLIWAGTERTNREHLYSVDGGISWNRPNRIFGELHGQARGDGISTDANGRVHFVSHIRYPSAIWHAIWDQNQWVRLTPIQPFDEHPLDEDEYNVHFVRLAIRSGNQMVIAFKQTVDEDAPLYVIHHTLEDVLASPPVPTPAPVSPATQAPATSTRQVEQSPEPIPTVQRVRLDDTTAATGAIQRGQPLWGGLIPTLLFLSVVTIFGWWKYR